MTASDGPGAVVFTDIVEFTRYNAERGDDAAVALLEQQSADVRALLPECARVVKELGDGLMLWIPDACAALETCLALQDRVGGRDASNDVDAIEIRVGAHWGSPRRRGDDFVGNVVNLAARIVDLAAAGEVLVSEALLAAAGDAAALNAKADELGPVFVKGVPDPVPLYRLNALGS
ncbi:MAG TPA: adenylate/guanylate cyclase domain-containing protein [Acidimicrobiia bacterium]|jgi:adenylate cyclase|nr:adenylate/guanylate cyclase domain-containing protein [Acidimicrobiia bacterium]